MGHLILAINPGSTSTKIAVFESRKQLFVTTLRHTSQELALFNSITEQFEFRKETILKTLKDNEIDLNSIEMIVGRGGLIKPIKAGVYEVNEQMIIDLQVGVGGEHASNLGGLIAHSIAKEIKGCRAFIADPVVVDELEPIARVTGHPLFERKSIFHALNQRAIAKSYATSLNVPYESLNLIVAHLGGGVSVGAHTKGRVTDVNNALNGEGPFSPERSGTLPAYDLAKLCFSGKYTLEDVKKMITGEGGLVAHLGTNSFSIVEKMVSDGDEKFILISEAFAYNVAKAIGAMAVVHKGEVDAILITGGIAYNTRLMEQISEQIKFIAPVKIFPGEDEMSALAWNGLAVLEGKETPLVYS
ncbi:MAG TPA: butyrate kinase [Rikenellaceae bacterium]|jgi:butyrate kinase|nr:MAG: butyrate kinase [Bacteroidetes bacterium GWE2_40_15]PKP05474.1 MAG: butyrate kinase [Bacteroidetes bacterium HGW-Bacteroidetes-5]HBZ25075.1 butyrate kinase [Rikenellaceae bacterium]